MVMKHWIKIVVIAVVALMAHRTNANGTELLDTVYFYQSWQQMFDMTPEAMIVNPYIETITPYQVVIETDNEELNENIYDSYIAATLNGEVWLINSRYLKQEFKGDTKKLNDFMPVFFNDKVAFAAYVGYGDHASLKEILFGDWVDIDYDEVVDYYYIDFMNRKVRKVTPEVLVDLLEDYHDLQMRYEGMRDFKKRDIIMDYFFKYVDRASDDIMRPYILDLVDTSM